MESLFYPWSTRQEAPVGFSSQDNERVIKLQLLAHCESHSLVYTIRPAALNAIKSYEQCILVHMTVMSSDECNISIYVLTQAKRTIATSEDIHKITSEMFWYKQADLRATEKDLAKTQEF